ncbi:trifunctional transcriptional regulator/proline dehydrogenase/L-glutamate gamma-semialdehyde dehydrogenase [Tepidicella baoligensis]|uniref:trifunctional transcriptional regulator/proline dehydrogenase/L-glutamate gamma-semialdehyde dehydrogenase n=1 Tax=Tepidicella baoligensis TaxID=2707016 RepID=UPI0015DB30E8|nr:trifunctional transcriptional regulator/proline dehydrogenase/L-glutamate gamma-semialdehyde dehydrogenase [Tepidicella baoligensis]
MNACFPSQALPPNANPFAHGVDGPLKRSPLRAAITSAWRLPEPALLPALLESARLTPAQQQATQSLARQLAQALRDHPPATGRQGLVQGLLQEYALSSQEGVALMCLAEALLRIPDAATRDALIRDKVGQGQWATHLGQSRSLFVNAATWGLLLTGKLVATHSEQGLQRVLGGLLRKGGEPLVRKGVDMAMRLMGEQFVMGETIAQALDRARHRETQGFRHSYDMLGEAALTADDADRYRRAYESAIHAIGQAAQGRGVIEGPGISIKLSALHPRYSRAQYRRVMDELYPVLLALVRLAQHYRIGLNIDAEEADRLELSLDLLERLCQEPDLAGFDGIGFVVQAYQKRCPAVIDHLIDLARRSGHRLMVRLVKGAYWDSEIKRAQLDGLEDYPVYTRKAYTDVAYLACARRLLAAPDAIYPQFATHNAHTVAAIVQMADPARYHSGQYEFQCLHGMGEALYEQVVGSSGLGRPCRIYAPVGTHDTLLAYLVRRLLENGANTSFVHQIADPRTPIAELVQDPVARVEQWARQEGRLGLPHPAIPLPSRLYGSVRVNSAGIDLANEQVLASLLSTWEHTAQTPWRATPMLAHEPPRSIDHTPTTRLNPADQRDPVGAALDTSPAQCEHALAAATAFAPHWATTPVEERAAALDRAADALQASMPRLLGLLMREAGKTAANAVAEVREAIDFLRFYAAQVRFSFDNHTHQPLGPVVCISPWNFPLAIFTGQVAAALAAGNTVLAKPAEQTPLIATEAVRLLWQAGIPPAALQLLPGPGDTVGAALVADARVQGVLFTGSTEVARLIQRTLAQRLSPRGHPIPLIAETGGQNAMIVDASALPEQVVQDAIASAFDSAGQRCSALRVLCIQDDVYDRVLTLLQGAMTEQRLGPPTRLAVDIGPVIDAEARAGIEAHIDHMRQRGHTVYQAARVEGDETVHGHFVLPTLIEIPHLGELQREVFGPVLHVLRYARRDLPQIIEQINATGYGLTLGVHSRIDETITQITRAVRAGNQYVNRNMVGAVVGVQPFGGEGLSGTGPKAGGPLYLYRLLAQRPADALTEALRFIGASQPEVPSAEITLPGPTGERNLYKLHPRRTVRAGAPLSEDALRQPMDAVVFGGSQPDLAALLVQLAQRPGPIVNVFVQDDPSQPLPAEAVWTERSLSINTAAAGGNASLMMLAG